ncbi:MAG: hypothetical protein ACMUIP_13635 [bacterium]
MKKLLYRSIGPAFFPFIVCLGCVYASPVYFENLIEKPKFELYSSEIKLLEDSPEALDPKPKLEMDGHTSAQSISITGWCNWSTDINGVKPSTYYLLSFWVKRDAWKDGEYPYVSVFNQEIYLNELFFWGGWRRVSYIVNSGNNNRTTLKLISKGLTEKIQFDDLNLQEFKIIPLSPSNDELIKDKLPTFTWAIPDDTRVYSISIELARDTLFTNKKSYFLFSPEGNDFTLAETIQNGKWYWRLILNHSQIRLATSPIVSFTMLNAPSSSDNADLTYNYCTGKKKQSGKNFFPIGIYSAKIETFKELKNAGFTLVQSYNHDPSFINNFASNGHKQGLKALCTLSTSSHTPNLSAFLRKIKNEPGLYGWYIADEPEGRGISPEYIWKWSRYIHSIDADHPTALVNVRSKMASDYGPAVDILMVDPYPVPHMPLTWLSNSIDEAREGVGDKKPVWAVIQAFNWANVGKDRARGMGRYPTYEEMRCLTFLSLVHGAGGLMYFSYNAARENDPGLKNWRNVKRIVSELKEIYPLLTASVCIEPNSEKKFFLRSVSCKTCDDGEDKARDTDGNPSVHYSVKKIDADSMGYGYWLIAVNVIDKDVSALFNCSGMDGSTVHVLFEKRMCEISEGVFRDDFKAYEVHVYFLKVPKVK